MFGRGLQASRRVWGQGARAIQIAAGGRIPLGYDSKNRPAFAFMKLSNNIDARTPDGVSYKYGNRTASYVGPDITGPEKRSARQDYAAAAPDELASYLKEAGFEEGDPLLTVKITTTVLPPDWDEDQAPIQTGHVVACFADLADDTLTLDESTVVSKVNRYGDPFESSKHAQTHIVTSVERAEKIETLGGEEYVIFVPSSQISLTPEEMAQHKTELLAEGTPYHLFDAACSQAALYAITGSDEAPKALLEKSGLAPQNMVLYALDGIITDQAVRDELHDALLVTNSDLMVPPTTRGALLEAKLAQSEEKGQEMKAEAPSGPSSKPK